MQALKDIYLRALDNVGDLPSLKKDWRWVLAWSLLIYAVVLAFRLSFAGRWDHPELWVGSERLMATHDAYFWLAKAKGLGEMATFPLAQAAHYLHGLLGVSYGTIGFWVPAFMGALVGVVCYLWGWLLGGRHAGIFAGLIGSLTPGFFYRSRLGYFDTDMFTLFAPMLTAWLLAYWARNILKPGWGVKSADDPGQCENPGRLIWLAIVFGLCARGLSVWHNDILNLVGLYVLFAAVLVAVQARPGHRAIGFWGLSAFVLAAYPGAMFGNYQLWPLPLLHLSSLGLSEGIETMLLGLVLAAGIALLVRAKEKPWSPHVRNAWVALGFLVLVVLWSKVAVVPISKSLAKLLDYASPSGGTGVPVSEIVGPIYPSIIQSIIEAKRVALSIILERGTFSIWAGWIALIFMVVVALLRPLSAFLIPFVVLHLASVSLGIRFSMFGGAALMVFLGVGVWFVLEAAFSSSSRKGLITLSGQVLLGAAFLVYAHTAFTNIPITPVLSKQHAEALIEVGKKSPADATIWTWWDWGYATQYYAGRKTVVDGGRHAGRYVFPVAFALSSVSAEKSNRMIAFTSQHPIQSAREFGFAPFSKWDGIPRNEIDRTLQERLSRTDYPPTPPQYLVASWKDVRLAKWITYFGNWNLQTGETRQATLNLFDPGELGINVQKGAVMNREGGGGLVKDITMLDWDSSRTQNYFMNSMSPRLLPKRQHLLVNKVTRQSVVMDRIAYQSLMRKLLTEDPKDPEISKYFRLVVDKLPFARIYEVIQ